MSEATKGQGIKALMDSLPPGRRHPEEVTADRIEHHLGSFEADGERPGPQLNVSAPDLEVLRNAARILREVGHQREDQK